MQKVTQFLSLIILLIFTACEMPVETNDDSSDPIDPVILEAIKALEAPTLDRVIAEMDSAQFTISEVHEYSAVAAKSAEELVQLYPSEIVKGDITDTYIKKWALVLGDRQARDTGYFMQYLVRSANGNLTVERETVMRGWYKNDGTSVALNISAPLVGDDWHPIYMNFTAHDGVYGEASWGRLVYFERGKAEFVIAPGNYSCTAITQMGLITRCNWNSASDGNKLELEFSFRSNVKGYYNLFEPSNPETILIGINVWNTVEQRYIDERDLSYTQGKPVILATSHEYGKDDIIYVREFRQGNSGFLDPTGEYQLRGTDFEESGLMVGAAKVFNLKSGITRCENCTAEGGGGRGKL